MDHFIDPTKDDDSVEGLAAEAAAASEDEDETWYGKGHPIVRQLHGEVRSLQENFTKYCFQAVSICSVTAGVIFHYMKENPYVGMAAIVLLPIVLITSRLGTNNYASIQRILGYELHLARTLDVPERFMGRWKGEYRRLKWEEAMRAWRIIQPSLFEKIYTKGRLFLPADFKRSFRPSEQNPMWFCQKSLLGQNANATWYPGTYLQVMQRILYSVAAIALLIMFITPAIIWNRESYVAGSLLNDPLMLAEHAAAQAEYLIFFYIQSVVAGLRTIASGFTVWAAPEFSLGQLPPLLTWSEVLDAKLIIVSFAFFIGALVVTGSRFAVDAQRRKAMEDGLLSIHACAIVWQAVVIAHYEAVALSRRYGLPTSALTKIVVDAGDKAIEKLKDGTAEDIIRAHTARVAIRIRPDGAGLMGYTFWLGQEASSLAAYAKDIHDWNGLRDRVPAI